MSDQPIHDLYEGMDDEAMATAARNASSAEAALRVHQHATACITERYGEDLCRQKLHNMIKTFGASTPLSAQPTDEELKRRRQSMKSLEMTLVGLLEADVFTDAVYIDKEFLWPRHQAADEGTSPATEDVRPAITVDDEGLERFNKALVRVIRGRHWLERSVEGRFWEFVQTYTEHPKPKDLLDVSLPVTSGPMRDLLMHLDYERLRYLQTAYAFATLMRGQVDTIQRLEGKMRLKLEELEGRPS